MDRELAETYAPVSIERTVNQASLKQEYREKLLVAEDRLDLPDALRWIPSIPCKMRKK